MLSEKKVDYAKEKNVNVIEQTIKAPSWFSTCHKHQADFLLLISDDKGKQTFVEARWFYKEEWIKVMDSFNVLCVIE